MKTYILKLLREARIVMWLFLMLSKSLVAPSCFSQALDGKKMFYARVESDFSWLNKLHLRPAKNVHQIVSSSNHRRKLMHISWLRKHSKFQNALELINEDPIIARSFFQLWMFEIPVRSFVMAWVLTLHGIYLVFLSWWSCHLIWFEQNQQASTFKKSNVKRLWSGNKWQLNTFVQSQQNVQSNQTDRLHLICWYSKTRLDCC